MDAYEQDREDMAVGELEALRLEDERDEARDMLAEMRTARNRALHIIRKAARWQGEEHGFLGRELRDRGILP